MLLLLHDNYMTCSMNQLLARLYEEYRFLGDAFNSLNPLYLLNERYVGINTFIFERTNESLDPLIAGLGLGESMYDDALAICGSGDVPFVLCPYVRHVDAVDLSRRQVNYAKHRLPSESELMGPYAGTIDDEFVLSNKSCLESLSSDILESAENIDFHVRDIIPYARQHPGKYDIVYVSNAIYSLMAHYGDAAYSALGMCLRPGGYLYFVSSKAKDVDSVVSVLDIPGFTLDVERTAAAWNCDKSGWSPYVYRKNNDGKNKL